MQLAWRAAAIVALLGTAALPAVAQQATDDERRGGGSLRVYTDDDHMRVVSPSAGAQAPLGDWLIDVRMTADAVSGASVDVISEASPTAMDEHRLELGLGSAWQATRRLTLRGQVIGSTESDYDSLTGVIGADLSVAQRNTTLSVLYRIGLDTVGHAKRPEVDESKRTQGLTVSATQVIDTRTYVDVIVEGLRSSGYLESPYRTVPMLDPVTPDIMRVAEEIPDTRTGVAMLGRVRRALGSTPIFVHADYRFYADDWSVESHTVSANVLIPTWRRAILGFQARGYLQTQAEFYRPSYTLVDGEVHKYRTREKRLGPMRSVLASVTVDMPVHKDRASTPRVILGVAGLRFWFPEFPAQADRNAVTITASVNAPF